MSSQIHVFRRFNHELLVRHVGDRVHCLWELACRGVSLEFCQAQDVLLFVLLPCEISLDRIELLEQAFMHMTG